jgi:biopolymer transport protein ExbB/TolQ
MTMEQSTVLTLAASLVATMFGLVIAVLGWLGSRVYSKLDEMSVRMDSIASELHTRINGLDHRVTVVETRCEVNDT